MGAARLTEFVVVVEYVISAIKYLNSHDQLPVDLMAQSVRALSRALMYSRGRGFKSHRGHRFFFDLGKPNFLDRKGFRVSFHIGLHGGAHVRTDGRTEVTS